MVGMRETDGLVLAGGAARQLRKPRKGGWTNAKKQAFLAALAGTCNIAAALRKVRMCRSGLDGLRARDGAFRAAMREAIRTAYSDLELFAIEKIMTGTVKTVTRADGAVETTHEYPLGHALQLLRLHKDGAAAADSEPDLAAEGREEVVERLLRKVKAVRARMERQAALPAPDGRRAAAPGEAEG